MTPGNLHFKQEFLLTQYEIEGEGKEENEGERTFLIIFGEMLVPSSKMI